MQLLILHSDPEKAAYALKRAQHPGKLLVEACQILSTALHSHGVSDPRLHLPFNKNHPCVLWAASGKDAIRWILKHARALHRVHNEFCRARCKKCRGFTSDVHKSLATLDYIEALVASPDLPRSIPERSDPDTFYATLKQIRANSRSKSGEVLVPSIGLPKGVATCAIAVDANHQRFCIAFDEQGQVDAVETYKNYNNARVFIPTLDASALASPTYKLTTDVCECPKRPSKRRLSHEEVP